MARDYTIGNIVWNPPGSGVKLALARWIISCQFSNPTCYSYALGYGVQLTAPTDPLEGTSGCCFLGAIGGSPGKAKVYYLADLATSLTTIQLLAYNSVSVGDKGMARIGGDFEGGRVVLPGYVVGIKALSADSAPYSGISSVLIWEEVPIG
jgi:hypothetical protein